MAQRGPSALKLSLLFDEMAALEANRAYLLRTLDLESIELVASASEEDGAIPGEPVYRLS